MRTNNEPGMTFVYAGCTSTSFNSASTRHRRPRQLDEASSMPRASKDVAAPLVTTPVNARPINPLAPLASGSVPVSAAGLGAPDQSGASTTGSSPRVGKKRGPAPNQRRNNFRFHNVTSATFMEDSSGRPDEPRAATSPPAAPKRRKGSAPRQRSRSGRRRGRPTTAEVRARRARRKDASASPLSLTESSDEHDDCEGESPEESCSARAAPSPESVCGSASRAAAPGSTVDPSKVNYVSELSMGCVAPHTLSLPFAAFPADWAHSTTSGASAAAAEFMQAAVPDGAAQSVLSPLVISPGPSGLCAWNGTALAGLGMPEHGQRAGSASPLSAQQCISPLGSSPPHRLPPGSSPPGSSPPSLDSLCVAPDARAQPRHTIEALRPPPLKLSLAATTMKRNAGMLSAQTPESAIYMKYLCMSPSPSTDQFRRRPAHFSSSTYAGLDALSFPLSPAFVPDPSSTILTALTGFDDNDAFKNVFDKMSDQGVFAEDAPLPPTSASGQSFEPPTHDGRIESSTDTGLPVPSLVDDSFASSQPTSDYGLSEGVQYMPPDPWECSFNYGPPQGPAPFFEPVGGMHGMTLCSVIPMPDLVPMDMPRSMYGVAHPVPILSPDDTAPSYPSDFGMQVPHPFPVDLHQYRFHPAGLHAPYFSLQPGTALHSSIPSNEVIKPEPPAGMATDLGAVTSLARTEPPLVDSAALSTSAHMPEDMEHITVVGGAAPITQMHMPEDIEHITAAVGNLSAHMGVPVAEADVHRVADNIAAVETSGPMSSPPHFPAAKAADCADPTAPAATVEVLSEASMSDSTVSEFDQTEPPASGPGPQKAQPISVERGGSKSVPKRPSSEVLEESLALLSKVLVSSVHVHQFMALLRESRWPSKMTYAQTLRNVIFESPANRVHASAEDCPKCMFPDCMYSILGFWNGAELARHVAAQHATRRPLTCEFCYRHFRRQATYAKHVVESHERGQQAASDEPAQILNDFVSGGVLVLPLALRACVAAAPARGRLSRRRRLTRPIGGAKAEHSSLNDDDCNAGVGRRSPGGEVLSDAGDPLWDPLAADNAPACGSETASADAEARGVSETYVGAASEPESDFEPESASELQSESESELESASVSQAESESESESEPEPEPEPESEPESESEHAGKLPGKHQGSPKAKPTTKSEATELSATDAEIHARELEDIVSEIIQCYSDAELTEPRRKLLSYMGGADYCADVAGTHGLAGALATSLAASALDWADKEMLDAGIDAGLLSDSVKAGLRDELLASRAMNVYLFTSPFGPRPVRDLLARSSRPAISTLNTENHDCLVQCGVMRRGAHSIRQNPRHYSLRQRVSV